MANGYIGHGVETDDKLVHFEGIMDWTVEMCAGKYKETPFYYIDLNAGSGQPIPGRDLIGSPLLAAKILNDRYGDASYRMVCVEQNGANLEELDQTLQTYQDSGDANRNRIQMIHGDNRQEITGIIRSMVRDGRGVVFHDPNGVPDHLELLPQFRTLPRQVDVLLYVQATSVKRVRNAFDDGRPDLQQLMDIVGKKQWLIREPIGKHQWTFMLGTNWKKFPEWKKEGFYRIDTEEGQRVFRRLNWTAGEREGTE